LLELFISDRKLNVTFGELSLAAVVASGGSLLLVSWASWELG